MKGSRNPQSAPICTQRTARRKFRYSQVVVFERTFFAKRTNLHGKYDHPKESIHFSITTRWAGAKDPLGENSAFNITLSEAELRRLIAALQSGLTNNA